MQDAWLPVPDLCVSTRGIDAHGRFAALGRKRLRAAMFFTLTCFTEQGVLSCLPPFPSVGDAYQLFSRASGVWQLVEGDKEVREQDMAASMVRALLRMLLWLLQGAVAMHQSRPGSSDYLSLLPRKRFLALASDLFLTNDISAKKFADLVEYARAAGAQTGKLKRGSAKNLARGMRRQVLKSGGKWPQPYHVQLPCQDPKTNEISTMTVPLWLPHEIVFVFQKHCGSAGWKDRRGLSPGLLQHLEFVERQQSLPANTLLALGLWCDAVPFSNNRLKSVELGALSLPGLCDDLRVPLWILPKDFIAPNITIKAVFQVMLWSFEVLLSGHMPRTRHDGTAWLAMDSSRRKWAGESLQPAILAQMRGDWQCYKTHFNLAGISGLQE